ASPRSLFAPEALLLPGWPGPGHAAVPGRFQTTTCRRSPAALRASWFLYCLPRGGFFPASWRAANRLAAGPAPGQLPTSSTVTMRETDRGGPTERTLPDISGREPTIHQWLLPC